MVGAAAHLTCQREFVRFPGLAFMVKKVRSNRLRALHAHAVQHLERVMLRTSMLNVNRQQGSV